MSYLQAPELPTVVVRQPGPPPVENDPPPDAIADLIQRAVSLDVPRLVKLADKIGDLVDQLEKDVAEHERDIKLRAEAAALEARLAEIRGQLTGKRAPAAAPGPNVDNKAVRKWAAARGLDCPSRGRIPRAVVEAFEGAHR
jgi:hypothetical protein